MNGTVDIDDSKLIIVTNGQEALYNIEIISDTDLYKSYKALGLDPDHEMRVSLNKDPGIKKVDAALILELKDNFSGSISKTIYYLNKK